MKIDILTLFPKMFEGPFRESIVKRAVDNKLVEIEIHNLRKWSKDKHKTVDGKPFGGGAGMVLMIEVIDRALRELKKQKKTFSGPILRSGPSPKSFNKVTPSSFAVPTLHSAGSPIKESPLTSITDISTESTITRVIFLTPQGKPYKQEKARELSKLDHLILICGHYEGVDERVREKLVDEEISVGDYVLTGGEIPAMAVVDSLVRLIPGVVGNKESVKDESFSNNSLEYPQYTRPAEYKGMRVPEVLLSGHHKDIKEWRMKESIKRTKKVRPDLV